MVQHADLDHTGLTGVPSGTAPNPTTIELGHASDTTLARIAAGRVSIEGNEIYKVGGTDVALADGGTGASLTDPNADRIMFWDDSAGAVTWLTPGTNLTITTTTIDAAGGGGVTVSENFLTAPVTMTTAGTWYDGPSLTLAAGTYVLIGNIQLLVLNATGAYYTARLHDGSATLADAGGYGNQFYRGNLSVHAYAVLGGSTTIKVQATQNANGGTIEDTEGVVGATDKASHLIAMKIA